MGATRDRWRRAVDEVGWDEPALRDLLERHSGLPGPRANLELAAAVADAAVDAPERARGVLVRWARLRPDAAPTGTRTEFLPFVAVQALGGLAARPEEREEALAAIRRASDDPRWRLREAAAIGLQRLGASDAAFLRKTLAAWVSCASPVALRLALAALADPPLLEDAETVSLAWDVADAALATVRHGALGSPEEARMLGQALAYAPSVFAAADPDRGFTHLARWAGAREPEVKKLVVANLRKARLARRFPEQCQELVERMWED